MELDEYQKKTSLTDQYPGDTDRGRSISLFGLIGEIGSLLTTFKKRLRDQKAYKSFQVDLREELGDVLWYLANIATKYGLSLEDIARMNLEKTQSLWGTASDLKDYKLYDETYGPTERLPRKMRVTFSESGEMTNGEFTKVQMLVGDALLGDKLTDNAYDDDGYRYHDCFHLAYAAVLGWSPVIRKLKGCKRKSNKAVDDVEDGARAGLTEEFIAQYVYDYARNHNYFEGTDQIDDEILKTIKGLVRGFEVANRPPYEWKMAILKGFVVFRQLRADMGGTVEIDLEKRSITYLGK